MDRKNTSAEQAKQWNETFAQQVSAAAMQVIRRQIAKEKEQGDLNCEVYYTLANPFVQNTPESGYVEALLSKGSARDANYIDLFDRLRSKLKEALDADGVHSFLMLNCRFDPQAEDNFLLYALVSWGG